VIADFGLTGYGRKKGQAFNHADAASRHDNIILQQWRKLRPNDITQRLNIVTLTDPTEIRKWFKADYLYKEYAFEKSKRKQKAKESKRNKQRMMWTSMRSTTKKKKSTTRQHEENGEEDQQHDSHDEHEQDHTHDNHEQDQQDHHHDLPKSDPVDIVLARCHFLLENETFLPPYHVFYSNSECIAVWCKTGRWSTLQTAVWCATNSVGAAKTSTLTTIGMAAASHIFLAPVVAVGGLLWVSAPMVILKKSREKWEEATKKLTQVFWEWAPPAIYVVAIEHWSGLVVVPTAQQLKEDIGATATDATTVIATTESVDDNGSSPKMTMPRRRTTTI